MSLKNRFFQNHKEQQNDGQAQETGQTEQDKLPVNRDYQFQEQVPENTADYKQHGKEKDKILADLKYRDQSSQLPRYLVGGPTGSGKTHLARAIAAEKEIPLITVQGKYSMDEADLLGTPMLINESTVWSDGPITKALLASQEGEVVLLLDEVNRAPPESKGLLFSVLDDRCQVELDARGGEVIKGDPSNLIVIGTMNEGSEYNVQELDLAEKRRFGAKWTVDYLGKTNPEAETEVVTNRTPASEPVAETLVEIANDIRSKSEAKDSMVNMGLPTANLLIWARTAFAYHSEQMSNPIVEAAKDAVKRPLYEDKEAEEVMEVVRDRADGAPFNKESFQNWKEDGGV